MPVQKKKIKIVLWTLWFDLVPGAAFSSRVLHSQNRRILNTADSCCWCGSAAHSCPTLCDPMDYSLTCSFVHGISQARILEWVAMSFSRGSSNKQTIAEQGESVILNMMAMWRHRYPNPLWLLNYLYSLLKMYLFILNWRMRKSGMLQFMGSQRVRHNLVTEQHQLLYNILLVSVIYQHESAIRTS